MSESVGERKDFKEWQVVIAYMAQEGVCFNEGCGNPLEHGFHRHHKDGNHSNVSLENLGLACPSCHRATLKEKNPEKFKMYEEHRKHEKWVFDQVNEAIRQTLAGKLAGSVVERLNEVMTLSLKMSHRMNGVDDDIEYLPLAVKLAFKEAERDLAIDSYLKGFEACLSSIQLRLMTVKGGE